MKTKAYLELDLDIEFDYDPPEPETNHSEQVTVTSAVITGSKIDILEALNKEQVEKLETFCYQQVIYDSEEQYEQ